MERVVIVGSGPSGVHFALSVLRKGYPVTMLDVGYERPAPVHLSDNFQALKRNLADPAAYFLGKNFEGVLLPNPKKEYYGIPPHKDYIFRMPAGFAFDARGFAPLFSFARGGLAEAWTAGCYPFNDAELADFPFAWKDIAPHYAEVARRIGVTGAHDDLERFHPWHEHLLEPLDFDFHSRELISQYEQRKAGVNATLRCYFGRTRVATLSRDHQGRQRCTNLGRCLWGCPTDSLWTPSVTLRECQTFANFEYVPDSQVTHFETGAGGRIANVVARSAGGEAHKFSAGRVVLAAGALPSTKIYLESILRGTGERIQLRGLMDNRQVLTPFVNLRLIGKPYNPESYQYHQLGLGIEADDPRHYIHGQVTTLKTAMLHPIMQNLPCDLRAAMFLVREMHCALGIVNINFHDTRREGNSVTLERDAASGLEKLVIEYAPAREESAWVAQGVAKVKRALWKLGCVVPPGMAHVRPMGASAHYAGTLPMSHTRAAHTTDEFCRSHEFENLFIVDGATYPFLPAKNITFTLMANAVRVAEAAF